MRFLGLMYVVSHLATLFFFIIYTFLFTRMAEDFDVEAMLEAPYNKSVSIMMLDISKILLIL